MIRYKVFSKRLILYLVMIIGCFACQPELKVNEFKTISEIIDVGEKTDKPVLLYFYREGCMACELFEYKILSDKQVQNWLAENFIVYRVDIAENLIFNKLFYFYRIPQCLVMDKGEIVSAFSAPQNTELFLYHLENFRVNPLNMGIASFSQLKEDRNKMADVMNDLFVLYSQIEKYSIDSVKWQFGLEKSVEKFPYFYNRYLLSESLRFSDRYRSDSLQNILISGASALEEQIYHDELMKMWNQQYQLDSALRSEVEFDHTVFDFGEVEAGVEKTHQFLFKNTGVHPLLIYYVKTSCGCTVPTWNRKPIVPGQTDSIQVVFTGASAGTINKSIEVITNSNQKKTVLSIKATVK